METMKRERFLAGWAVPLLCLALLGCFPRPSRRFPTCEPGQVRVCLGRCATPTAGGRCTPTRDECAPDFQPCPGGQVCRPLAGDPAVGSCVTPSSLFCDPGAPEGSPGNLCPAHAVCLRLGTPAEVAGHTACLPRPNLHLPPESLRGLCQNGLLEGERCDGEWPRALQGASGPQPCRPCAPGLVCWNQTCRRSCRPEEGGLDNCVPDARTQQFTEQWICETQTGRRTPSEAGSTLPLCTACVPPQNPCELPREALAQSRTHLPELVCCDPRDTCFAPIDLAVPAPNRPAECCRRPTYQEITGGACTQDSDCCPVTWMGLPLSHCCQGNERGCRAPGTCSGCGPGTGVACCEANGLGCRDGQACVGAGDQARCVACGVEGQACCPGDRCGDGNTCQGGVCRPCGNRGEICCAGRQCGSRFQRCTGPDPGHCEQTCGTLGLDCCGERGSIFGPDRGFCLDEDRSVCDHSAFRCRHCGAAGELGCGSGPACDPGLGLSPVTRTCETCGAFRQPCCSAEPRCFDDGQGNACASGDTCLRPPP